MTQTQTLFPELTAAPLTWGWFDVVRLSTPAELTPCVDCGHVATSKVSDHVIPMSMIGRRLDPRDTFTFYGPYCTRCHTARCIAEGCGDNPV